MALVEEISVDVVTEAVLSELGGSMDLKKSEEQNWSLFLMVNRAAIVALKPRAGWTIVNKSYWSAW